MENLNNGDTLQETNDGLKIWLKKYHEQLSSKNQALKSSLNAKQQINNEIKNDIDKLSKSFINTSCLAVDFIPNKVQISLEEGVNNLKIKSEQLNKCNESFNSKVEGERKMMRNKFYEMIKNDEVALKPFGEVEEAIQHLNAEIECVKKEQNELNLNLLSRQKERELNFNEIQQSILMMEPIGQELRHSLEKYKKNLDENLKSLKLTTVEEANEESIESKQLLADISNMETQLDTK